MPAPRQYSRVLASTPFSLHHDLFPPLPPCDGHEQQDTATYLPAARAWATIAAKPHVPKSVPTSTLPTPNGFLRLPLELRFMIWEYALHGNYNEIHVDSRYDNWEKDPVKPSFLPQVCYVSQQTMEETVEVVLKGSKINMRRAHIDFFQAFLDVVPSRYELVRYLSFMDPRFYPEGAHKDIELAAKCKRLRVIELVFSHHDLLAPETRNGSGGYLNDAHHPKVQVLFAKYGFEQLSECDMLKKIIMEPRGYHNRNDQFALRLRVLGELLKQMFENKPTPQQVEVEYHWWPDTGVLGY
ncbi:hypothetical protein N0V83_001944 [Neocucurbitaria cava]|uniref:2EXR domain-containing protein n=1 Tax=Neocucurbitaria cava TaxID=798079 RepID=A0A9W8YDR0_9PLEO|nr:hypothetical protein N0V83_001944 [Neocucurbitaria cava]